MEFTKQNQATLMRVYNRAKAAAKNGEILKNGKALEIGRVNRAFGILQSTEYKREYQTTINTCNCPDSKKNPKIACKHQVAMMIEVRVTQSETAAIYQAKNWEMAKVEAAASIEQNLRELGY